MPLPLFFAENIDVNAPRITLDDTNSRHIIQVLRMKQGDALRLTDGKGNIFIGNIFDEHKKGCAVEIEEHSFQASSSRKSTIAISLVKNAARFEWFLEKAVETGISNIVPLLCERTEKVQFRYDRMRQIMISAMLQSQQVWLPLLSEPVKFKDWLPVHNNTIKCIAHCNNEEKYPFRQITDSNDNITICIGPEGDFTEQEITLALQHAFKPVSLGNTRLRTETAGIAAAVLLAIK
ncbi:MAG: RsmE family RNA methyltransferase [Agriterribacter sp.]